MDISASMPIVFSNEKIPESSASADKTLNKMYFEIMLKEAFSISSADDKETISLNIFNDVYMQSFVSNFAQDHELGFGQMRLTQLDNGKVM